MIAKSVARRMRALLFALVGILLSLPALAPTVLAAGCGVPGLYPVVIVEELGPLCFNAQFVCGPEGAEVFGAVADGEYVALAALAGSWHFTVAWNEADGPHSFTRDGEGPVFHAEFLLPGVDARQVTYEFYTPTISSQTGSMDRC